MKLIIAGGRDIVRGSYQIIEGAILFYRLNKKITEIISGGATGVDNSAYLFTEYDWKDQYPVLDGKKIKYTEFIADWEKHGRAAGPIRNKEMAEYGDALLLIWDGESKGSNSMKKEMEKLCKPIYEIIIRK